MSQLARMDEALDQELVAECSSSGGGGVGGGKVLALASIPSSVSLGSLAAPAARQPLRPCPSAWDWRSACCWTL